MRRWQTMRMAVAERFDREWIWVVLYCSCIYHVAVVVWWVIFYSPLGWSGVEAVS